MEDHPDAEIVEVLDRHMRVIFRGPDNEAVDWICEHALGPDQVWLVDSKDLVSVDDFLNAWDLLN